MRREGLGELGMFNVRSHKRHKCPLLIHAD